MLSRSVWLPGVALSRRCARASRKTTLYRASLWSNNMRGEQLHLPN